MLGYVYGQDQAVAQFTATLIPHCRRGFGACKAIGVVEHGYLIAGFVYHNWDPEAEIIEISGAALPGHRWCTPMTLAHIYRYPFLQLDCQMIVQRVPAANERLLSQLSRLNYAFVPFPRLFGSDADGVICLLTVEAWAANKICQRYRHHVLNNPQLEAA
jgi:hypothetical protein